MSGLTFAGTKPHDVDRKFEEGDLAREGGERRQDVQYTSIVSKDGDVDMVNPIELGGSSTTLELTN